MYGLTGNGALLLTTAATFLASPVYAWAGGHPEALPASSYVSSISGEPRLLYHILPIIKASEYLGLIQML